MKLLPIMTEKSFRLAAGDKKSSRQFSFFIDSQSNQIKAKRDIEKMYKVDIINSQIIKTKRKPIRFRQILGKKAGNTKIIVKLKPGQTIKAFEIEEDNQRDNKIPARY